MPPKQYAFHPDNLSKAPTKAGVYGLYQGPELVYIGRAKGPNVTIRSRLQDHYAGREGSGTQQATSYVRIVTTSPVTTEKKLLKAHEQKFGRLPRYNERIG